MLAEQKKQVEGNVSSALSLLDIMKRDITNRLRVWLVTSEPGAADLLTGNGEQSWKHQNNNIRSDVQIYNKLMPLKN